MQESNGKISFTQEVDEGKLIGALVLEVALIQADLSLILEQLTRIAKRVGLSEPNFREGTARARQNLVRHHMEVIEQRLAKLKPPPGEATVDEFPQAIEGEDGQPG